MSYCVTPGCLTPQNPDSAQFCFSCGSKLRLKERYRSIRPIGRGGFGRTFLAVDEDIPSKPRCVIKQLCLQSQGSLVLKKAVQLFHQEAERLDELGKHPQIPTLLAHFEHNRLLYLVQELIEGETLEQELERRGVFNEAQIWDLLRDLLPVLKFVHDCQVIHRDIKPANVIRRRSGSLPYPSGTPTRNGNGIAKPDSSALRKLVLIDFGVAKLLTRTALLHTGTTVGSPEYMSPEQTKGKALQASDLYSLGVTCIHLLTNIPPFDMFDVINNRWAWRDYLLKDNVVSDRLGRILDKLLENTVAKRYQSASEVLDALNSTPRATHPHLQRTGGNDLVSELGIDYTRLRDLLARKKWKEADQQTWDILCQTLGKAPGYYLQMGDINKLSCEDLLTIDKLWVKYSDGRFGFSVQKYIYEDVGEDYPSFCDRIGWPIHNPLNLDSALKFNLKAPMGHLPSRRWVGGYSWWRHAGALAAKLEQCGIT